MTAIYLLPLLPRHWSILLALWLSPETSTPFFALPYHFKMYLETLTPFSPRRDPRSSATLWTIWRAWEVKTRMGILMFVAAQTWNTTCIPSHDRLWVNTHTVLLTLILDQERSDLFFQCSTHSRWMTHWTSLGVCVLAIFLQCSSTLSWAAHSTWYTSRSNDLFHAISCRSKPIPIKLCTAPETSIFSKLPPYICIPHKMFLHFMERLENVFNGSLQRSPP